MRSDKEIKDGWKKASKKYYNSHKEYSKNKTKKYREAHKEEIAKYTKEYEDKVHRNKMLKTRYGITVEDYDIMYTKQEGKCAICGKHQSELSKRLHVDHSHITNKIRGLLCNNCNKALGLFYDNVETIERALNYVKD